MLDYYVPLGALRGGPAVGVESNGVRTRGILPPFLYKKLLIIADSRP